MGFSYAGRKPRALPAGRLAACWLATAAVGTIALGDEAANRPVVRTVQYSGQGQGQTAPRRGAQTDAGPQMPNTQRKSSGQRPRGGGPIVLSAFAKTKTASSEADFSEIIEMCHQGLDTGLDGSMTVYTRRLMGWAHNRRGELRAEQDEQEAALKDFEAAVALDETKWRYVHNRGVSHATLGHYDKAITDFNQTLKMNSTYGNAYFNRGELRYERRDFVGAIGDYTQAIKLDPRDATAYNSRGHAHYRLQEFREALADYHQAVRLDPQNAAAYTNRGDMYADFGRWANATSDYKMAMKLNPRLGRAYQSAAWLLATCPDESFRSPNGAMLAAKKAIELDGENDYRYLETLAAAEASAGRFHDAIDTQNAALAIAADEYRAAAENRLGLYQRQTAYREMPRNLAQATANRPSRRPEAMGR